MKADDPQAELDPFELGAQGLRRSLHAGVRAFIETHSVERGWTRLEFSRTPMGEALTAA